MNATCEIESLIENQESIRDTYRLFQDGSIKHATVTSSLEKGWAGVAGPVPGAAREFRSLFQVSGEEFVKVEDLRKAIAVRDLMFQDIKAKTKIEPAPAPAPEIPTLL